MRSITRTLGHGFGLVLIFAVLSCAPAEKRIETSITVTSPCQFNHGFEKNQGQTDKSVRFLLRSSGQTLFFTDHEAVMTLSVPRKSAKGAGRQRRIDDIVELSRSKVRDEIRMAVVRMKFDGADQARRVTGEQPLRSKIHYNIGGAGRAAQSGVPTYSRMRYRAVWPGIDAIFSLEEGRLRYDFVVAPGADPAKIRLSFTGAEKITVDRNGDLVIDTPAGEIRHTAPKIYQPAPGRTRHITGRYKVSGMQVGFELGDYDRAKSLIIHPVIFAGLHGGDPNLSIHAKLATGADGALYVLSTTVSPDLPGPHQTEYVASYDAYVAKFDLSDPSAPGAGTPLYVTYLGGSDRERAQGITVDSSSQVYVTGGTRSADFLQTQAATISPTFTYSRDSDVFVVRLRSDGIPDAFTFLGGSESDSVRGIAVDATGIYVAGTTESADFRTAPAGQTPVTPFYPYTPGVPADGTHDLDAYIIKLEPDLSAVRYFSFLGGSKSDLAKDVAVRDGAAYLTGNTRSPDFRTRNAVQNYLNSAGGSGVTYLTSDGDVFVARFKPESEAQVGNALDFSTYLGGDKEDRAYGIAVDTSGAAYIAGYSFGSAVNFPTTANALQPSHSHLGQTDAVLAKLGANGSLLYSTFLGGTGSQWGREITVDTAGNVFITGDGGIRPINNFIPSQPPTPCDYTGGWGDVFVAKFLPDAADPATLTIDWWCLIGGSSWDYSFDVAVDGAGGTYVSGNTGSPDFFTTPDLTPPTGLGQTFLVKIVEGAPLDLSVTKTDEPLDPVEVNDNLDYTLTVTNNGPNTATSVTLTDTLPAGFDYTGFRTIPPGAASCTESGGVVTCELGTMAQNDTVTVQFIVTPTLVGTFTNTATVESGNPDPDAGNNTVEETTTVEAATPVQPTDHLIAFTSKNPVSGNTLLRVRSFLDSSVVQDLHSHSEPYRIEYDRAGTRMALIWGNTGSIHIVDAVTHSILYEPTISNYKLYDIDFNPQDNTKFAIVGSEIANPDQDAIFIFEGATELSCAPLLKISRPKITWSPNGSRISAAFTMPDQADTYDVYVSEWNVVDNQIVLPPVGGIYDRRPGLQNRETIREIVYQDDDWRAVGSDRTITRAIKRPGSAQILPIFDKPNKDLDLTDDGKAAALLFHIVGHTRILAVARPLDQNAAPDLYQGPALENITDVAISSDASYVAVGIHNSDPTTDKVLVYSIPDFNLVKEIRAYRPRNLAFKPIVP